MNALTANRRKEVVTPEDPEVISKDTAHLDDSDFVLATTKGEEQCIVRPHLSVPQNTYALDIQWTLVFPTTSVPHQMCRMNQVLDESG